VVIVAQQVQQPVQRQDTEFSPLGMASHPRLTSGHSARDHDVAEKTVYRGGRRSR